jgi:predicted nucleotidyltransferase
MLEKLLKSKTAADVLGALLFSSPLHLREIARRVGKSPIHVQKELTSLSELNLVLNYKVGNLSMWEMNKNAPLYPEIKSMYLKTDGLGVLLGKLLEGEEIVFALIYGSFAKGKESEKSDIDLFLVGQADEKKLITAISEAEEKTGREVSYILWREGEFRKNAGKKHHLLLNIRNNPIIWIKGDKDEFERTLG